MRSSRVAAIVLPFVVSITAFAQSTWDKTYNVNGKAALNVEVDDASVRVTACGTCRTVHIHVDGKGADLAKFRVTEMQGGNGIHFSLRHPEVRGFFSPGWHGQSPEVTIQTPAETQVTASSGNGSLAVNDLRGGVDVHTGNGGLQLTGVSGALRATSGDGSVQVSRAEGTLFATTGNGSMTLEGRFSQVEARAGNGGIHISLLPGTRLSASARITTGNGSIALQVPRDLQATIEANAGSGSIANSLPLVTNTGASRNSLYGSMNGGGPTLRLQAGSGSIALSAR